MPMSRCLKNEMRAAKGPGKVSNNMGKSLKAASVDASSGGGKPNKQYTTPKVKNSAPRYPQSDKATAKYGKSGLK